MLFVLLFIRWPFGVIYSFLDTSFFCILTEFHESLSLIQFSYFNSSYWNYSILMKVNLILIYPRQDFASVILRKFPIEDYSYFRWIRSRTRLFLSWWEEGEVLLVRNVQKLSWYRLLCEDAYLEDWEDPEADDWDDGSFEGKVMVMMISIVIRSRLAIQRIFWPNNGSLKPIPISYTLSMKDFLEDAEFYSDDLQSLQMEFSLKKVILFLFRRNGRFSCMEEGIDTILFKKKSFLWRRFVIPLNCSFRNTHSSYSSFILRTAVGENTYYNEDELGVLMRILSKMI